MEHATQLMLKTKHAQQVLNLLKEQGILRPGDLDSIGVCTTYSPDSHDICRSA